MARYQHLPIFQAAYDLNIEIHRRVENFPRVHRYSMGERLKSLTMDFLDLMVKANSVQNKFEILTQSEFILEKLKIYIRTCFDLKIFGPRIFEFLIRKIEDICQQLSKWKNWSKKGNL
ncbi:MAG: four helix bundle protein [Candidatus Moraniibacteriota bacterium]